MVRLHHDLISAGEHPVNDVIPRPQAKTPKALTPLLEIRNLTKSFDGTSTPSMTSISPFIKAKFLPCWAHPAAASQPCCACWRDLNSLPPDRLSWMASIWRGCRRISVPINMMFQSYALFPHMTVEQNIAFGLKQDKLPKAEITSRVQEMLALVHMQEFAKRKPHQLSGGTASARGPGPQPGEKTETAAA